MKNNVQDVIFHWDDVKETMSQLVPHLLEKEAKANDEVVVNYMHDQQREKMLAFGFPDQGLGVESVVERMTKDVYPHRMKTSHRGYYCFMQNEISPYSVLGEFINNLYNPYAAGIQLSEGTALLEEETLRFLAEQVGYDPKVSGGQFVSGGSIGNMTALMMARDHKVEPKDYHKSTIYISDQTHSSIKKSARLIGFPLENVRVIPSLDDFTIDLSLLRQALEEDVKNGMKPCCLVGSCGTTNTGTIDPLEALADMADDYDMWFHVDGAYGASVILSSHKDLAKGMERSDSMCWDGHKWLYQTFGSSMFICKDKAMMAKTFHTNPEYLHDVELENDFNYWDLGIEMTRPGRGMKLWFTFQVLGMDTIKCGIDQGISNAKWMEEEVRKHQVFEVLSQASLGIFNFRYVHPELSEDALNAINHKISEKSLEKNERIFLTTTLKGKTSLRFCVKNPMTRREDIRQVIDDILTYVDELV